MKSGPFFKRRNALDTKRPERPQTTTKVDDCRILFLARENHHSNSRRLWRRPMYHCQSLKTRDTWHMNHTEGLHHPPQTQELEGQIRLWVFGHKMSKWAGTLMGKIKENWQLKASLICTRMMWREKSGEGEKRFMMWSIWIAKHPHSQWIWIAGVYWWGDCWWKKLAEWMMNSAGLHSLLRYSSVAKSGNLLQGFNVCFSVLKYKLNAQRPTNKRQLQQRPDRAFWEETQHLMMSMGCRPQVVWRMNIQVLKTIFIL